MVLCLYWCFVQCSGYEKLCILLPILEKNKSWLLMISPYLFIRNKWPWMVGDISSCTGLVIFVNRIIFLVLPLSLTWDLLLSNSGNTSQADELKSAMKGTEATQEPVKSRGSSFQSHEVPGLKNNSVWFLRVNLKPAFFPTHCWLWASGRLEGKMSILFSCWDQYQL